MITMVTKSPRFSREKEKGEYLQATGSSAVDLILELLDGQYTNYYANFTIVVRII